MNRSRRAVRVLAVVVASVLFAGIASAQDAVKPLAGWQNYPGYLFYLLERPAPHCIEMRVVPEGVVTGYGLKLTFPDFGPSAGAIFRELGRKDGKDFSGFEGFSVWVKGDGSDAKGLVKLDYGNGPAAAFPLKDTNWHRVDLKWADFQPAPDTKNVQVLSFTLSPDSKRPASCVIDRPGFVKSFAQLDAADKAADVKPKTLTVEMGERGPDLARYVINGDQLVRTKAKLKAKEPLTIVAWGDSITMGSQLWTSGDKDAQAKAIYHALLAEKLKKKYGDDAIKVVNSSKGGYQTHQALPNIQKEVLDYKPDLVIMAVCAGDTLYSNFDTFKTNWTKIVEKLRAEGIEVIVRTPTPIEYGVKQGEPFAEYIRTYAKEQKLPMDDQRACFLARGEAALGELIPDDAHPNQRGHELMADVLFELFK